MTITEQIRKKAIELGFSKIGFAKAEPLGQEGVRLHEWLNRGFHASMNWMEKNTDKRTDPGAIVPNARSVISLAVNYYTSLQHSPNPKTGKISRYAWGDDYHIHVTKRIHLLFESIKQIDPEADGRYYVDTGPVMEKVWAQRAGIGWQGKHTNLITKEFGSWVFLGEIITTLPLEYDAPMEDFCGSCTACIEACPTHAIDEPYVLDSNKCISYLTIEHRGNIDDTLGKDFNNWLYGCDICQDVCPWNKFQQTTDQPEYFPREFNKAPSIEEITEITQEEFSHRFKNSPIKRTKRDGLKRNAEVISNNVAKTKIQ